MFVGVFSLRRNLAEVESNCKHTRYVVRFHVLFFAYIYTYSNKCRGLGYFRGATHVPKAKTCTSVYIVVTVLIVRINVIRPAKTPRVDTYEYA